MRCVAVEEVPDSVRALPDSVLHLAHRRDSDRFSDGSPQALFFFVW